jgi:hypothetical protein
VVVTAFPKRHVGHAETRRELDHWDRPDQLVEFATGERLFVHERMLARTFDEPSTTHFSKQLATPTSR